MAVSRAQSHASPVLERGAEIAALTSAIDGALTGVGGVAVIDGPAGIGKTTLLHRAAQLAAPHATVATARGSALEAGFAHGVLLQLLGPLVIATPGAAQLFEGPAALAQPLFERGVPSGDVNGELPFLHGLHWLCAALAERRPLVLCVDDVQWADSASLRFLAYLGARAADLPLLLVCAARSGEEPTDAAVLRELCDGPAATRIEPGPLTVAAVKQLVAGELGSAAAADLPDACWRRTGGNPLFVAELLRAAGEAQVEGPVTAATLDALTPDSVVRLVERRVARQDDAVLRVARALAILGERARPADLAQVTGLDPAAALGALDALVAAELTEADAPTRFRHPILRQAVDDAVPPGERLALHADAAAAVRDVDAGRAAQHLVAADGVGPSPPWAVDVLRAAAATARARGGGEEAIRYLRRALETGPAPDVERDVLVELGTIEAHQKDIAALEHLERAAALAGTPVEHARIALIRGEALFYFAQLDAASAVCREAIAQLGDADRELWLALEALALSVDGLLGMRRERAGELAEEVAAASTPGERAVLAHVFADRAARSQATFTELRALGHRALGDGALLAEVGPDSPTLIYAGTALAWVGDYHGVLELTADALRLSRERGSLIGTIYTLTLQAGTALWRGDIAQAEAEAQMVVDELPVADPLAYAIALGWLIEARVERGRLPDARTALERSGMTGPLPDFGTVDYLLLARGLLAAAEGDLDTAVAEYEEVGRRSMRAFRENPGAWAWRSRLAEVHLRRGDRDAALPLLDAELDLARRVGTPRPLGVALRARAAAAEPADAVALLDEAVAVLRDGDARVELARALIALGAARHAGGDADGARPPLTEGMDLAHRCGATVLVDEAMDALRATGARPRRPRVRGADALTPQERRITRLAADGASNPEIAANLFLTRRTVEMHLSNAYRKLGIESRAALAAALDGAG